jgi:hypothetical protein
VSDREGNVMTEEEAKTKLCPMTFEGKRDFHEHAYQDDRHTYAATSWTVQPGFRKYCIGSACMVWRTKEDGGYCGLGGPQCY